MISSILETSRRQIVASVTVRFSGSSSDFAVRAGHFIAEINAVHPFREGNGRCQLTLLDILLQGAGFQMNEDRIDEAEFMKAMIASFMGEEVPLRTAIIKMAT